jgi:hypothetical protein
MPQNESAKLKNIGCPIIAIKIRRESNAKMRHIRYTVHF